MSIKRTYDSMGRIENITSYATADATGGASNDVQYAYDDLQALSVEYQEHAGAVNTGASLKVQYGYDSTNSAGVFTKGYRPSSMTYPSTRVVYTLYADPGDSSGIGDAISRVTAIAGASTRGGSDANVLAAYYYNGMGRMVIKDLPQPDVKLDYNGGGGNTYVGFDRFGRIIDHLWRDYGASADRERFMHGYDRNSNRTWRDHTNTTTRDGFYVYDGLNRLTDYDRGDLNGTFSAVGTLSFAQKWDLKALGNWTAFKEDANGNGSFTEAGDLTQTRTHNAANEITGITETGGQTAWADPVQDAMGNVTSYPKPSSLTNSYTVKYDAWNRLVEIKDGANLVGAYVYDGLGRRITKKTYSGGVLDKTRQFFYTNKWQVIEERVDQRATNPLERHYVWGVGYVDELILRDRDTAAQGDGSLEQRRYGLQDANFSLTCIVDASGDAQERYLYTPYGTRVITDGSFANPSANGSHDWNIGHQGLMHDAESSLVCNRVRYLHPGLGRFMQRDPLGYVDGANCYEYVRGQPLSGIDPTGLFWPPVTGWPPGTNPIPTFPKPAPIVPPNANFEYWYTTQLAALATWYPALPSCPCSIPVQTHEIRGPDCELVTSVTTGTNPNSAVWENPSGTAIGRHPGAEMCMRSKPVGGSAQQCCYDKGGKLITHGAGAGTADRTGATFWDWPPYEGHLRDDVFWYDLALQLDGGTPGAHCAKYWQVRPINPGKDVGGNPCPKNP